MTTTKDALGRVWTHLKTDHNTIAHYCVGVWVCESKEY